MQAFQNWLLLTMAEVIGELQRPAGAKAMEEDELSSGWDFTVAQTGPLVAGHDEQQIGRRGEGSQ